MAGLEAPCSCRTRARRARRRAPARSSGSRTSPPRCASWSRPSGRRSPRARTARRRSTPPTTASTAATSPQELVARHARAGRAASRMEDLARWKVHDRGAGRRPTTRASRSTSCNAWTQGPAMLQALNILENVDLKAMGYNSARYIHTLYQAMNLAFADRDFYYGDPYVAARGAGARACSRRSTPRRGAKQIDWRTQRRRRQARRSLSVPGRRRTRSHDLLQKLGRRPRAEAARRSAASATAGRSTRSTTRRSAPARRRFRRPTRKAGWCR